MSYLGHQSFSLTVIIQTHRHIHTPDRLLYTDTKVVGEKYI